MKCLIAIVAVVVGLTCSEGSAVLRKRSYEEDIFDDFGNRSETKLSRSLKCNCACGERNEAPRIAGGEETGINEFPWMAYLIFEGAYYCGATLINDRYVLTAAHCIKDPIDKMSVTLGDHNLCDRDQPRLTRYVKRVVKFSDNFGAQNYDNDIALIRLDENISISPVISPVCLPSNVDNLYIGVKAIALGWGTSAINDDAASCRLQEVEIPVISNEACLNYYSAAKLTGDMLCAGFPETGKKDACKADSGGPLITERKDKNYELIGIISWGHGCGEVGHPGVYTRVNKYITWIIKNTQDACYCAE